MSTDNPVPLPEGMETTAEERKSIRRLAEGHSVFHWPSLLRVLDDLDRALAEIARLTAEQPPVPPDREKLARELLDFVVNQYPTLTPGECRVVRQAVAALRLPADGYREGAEAMREACLTRAEAWLHHADMTLIDAIRALPIPIPARGEDMSDPQVAAANRAMAKMEARIAELEAERDRLKAAHGKAVQWLSYAADAKTSAEAFSCAMRARAALSDPSGE